MHVVVCTQQMLAAALRSESLTYPRARVDSFLGLAMLSTMSQVTLC